MESLAWLDGALKGWAVSPACQSGVHNTLTAATRGDRNTPGSPRCTCPRGLELRDAAQQRRRLNDSARSRISPNASYTPDRPLLEQIPGGKRWLNTPRVPQRAPDFNSAPCGTNAGRELLERACDSREKRSALHRQNFVRLCRTGCGNYEDCLAWILNAETPAGSWGLIYSGLTVNDRRRVARERREADRQRVNMEGAGSDAGAGTTERAAGTGAAPQRRAGYGNRRGAYGSYG